MNLQTISKFLDFVTSGYEGINYWELRCISKDGNVKSLFFTDVGSITKYIKLHQEELSKINIYFGINPRIKEGRGDENVSFSNLLWVDLDSEKAIEDYNKIFQQLTNELNLRPSLIADSGHGLHIYWKMDKTIDSKEFRDLQTKLIEFFKKHFSEYKVDEAIKNPERIMRLIGSNNVKNEPIKESTLLIEDYTVNKTNDLKLILASFKKEEFISTSTPIPELTKELSQEQIEQLTTILKPLWIERHRDGLTFGITGMLMKEGYRLSSILELIQKVCFEAGDEEFNLRMKTVMYHEKKEDVSKLLGLSGLFKEISDILKDEDKTKKVLSDIRRIVNPNPTEITKLDLDSRIEKLNEGSTADDVKEILKELVGFDPYDQEEKIDKIAERINRPRGRLERQLRLYEKRRTDDTPKELKLIGLPTKERFLEIIPDAVSLGFNGNSDEFRVKELKVTGKITREDENVEFFDTIAHSSYSPKTKRTGNLGCVVGSSSGSGKNYVTDEVLKSYPNYKHISRITPAAVDRNFVNTNLDYTIFDFAEEKSLFSYNKDDTQQSSMIRQLLTEGELDLETLDENLNPKCLTTKGRPCFFLKTTMDIGDEQWHRRVCPKSLDETNIQTTKIVFDTTDDFFGKIELKEREPTFTKKYNEFIYTIQTGKALEWFNEDEEFKLKVLSKLNELFEKIDEDTVKTILTPINFITIPLCYKKIIEKEILKFLFEGKLDDKQLDKLCELFDKDIEEEEEVFKEKFKKLDESIKKVLEDIDPNRLIFRTLTPRLITFIQISALKNRFKRTHLVHDGGISLLADSYDVIKGFKFMFPYLKGYSFGKLRPSETKLLKSLSDFTGEKLVSYISEKVDIARPTVSKDVVSLFYKGLVNRTGTKSKGYLYVISENGKKALELFKLKKKGSELISANNISAIFLSKLKKALDTASDGLYANMGETKMKEIKFDSHLKIIPTSLFISTVSSYLRISPLINKETLDTTKKDKKALIILTDISSIKKSKEKEENDTVKPDKELAETKKSKQPKLIEMITETEKTNDSFTYLPIADEPTPEISKEVKVTQEVYRKCCNILLDLVKTFGEKILKPELKNIPKEVITIWMGDGTVADYGDYYMVMKPENLV
jgi:hypothetical protein